MAALGTHALGLVALRGRNWLFTSGRLLWHDYTSTAGAHSLWSVLRLRARLVRSLAMDDETDRAMARRGLSLAFEGKGCTGLDEIGSGIVIVPGLISRRNATRAPPTRASLNALLA